MKMQVYHVKFEKDEEPDFLHRLLIGSYDMLSMIASSMVAVMLVVVFLFRVANVVGSSMEPTLQNSDKIIITNITSNYELGDIVVIHRQDDVSIIKRVIGVEGDTVDIDFETGEVTINGQVLTEDYIAEPTYRSFADGPEFPLTVPKDTVFVLGDNRNNSLDSRSGEIGLVNVGNIVGKMIFEIGN